jgi:hypothetical protein
MENGVEMDGGRHPFVIPYPLSYRRFLHEVLHASQSHTLLSLVDQGSLIWKENQTDMTKWNSNRYDERELE